MISKETLREILLENRVEVEHQQIVPRDFVMEDFMNYVLIGVRRAGKSFLLYQQIQKNLQQGITWDSMLYLNFEDERLAGMTTSDLNLILEVHGTMSSQRPILFLDEIQNIDGWHKFARRLADWKYKVYITGSNAKMLSSEIATTLGGRYVMTHVLPYSFKEYLSANNIVSDGNSIFTTSGKAEIQRKFNEYFRFGGFPEAALLTSKRDYLSSVYQKIYLGDIASRNNIDNKFALKVLFRKMAESVKQPMSFTRLTNIISSTGTKIGKTTIINYIEYSKDAFLIYSIKNFADNFTQRETNSKYYFVDNGIISLLAMDINTSLLENMVAIELLRRYGHDSQVFFYNHNIEVDFYIPDAELAIQVSYNPHSEDNTWQRETTALIKLDKAIPCKKMLILSYEEESTVEIDGKIIEVMPVWKWLIE